MIHDADTPLSEAGEDALVARLCALLPQGGAGVIVGPGDDCAVVSPPPAEQLLKTDVIVENVHFLRSADPFLIGRKALARNISDIAAMGGVPLHALVTLVLPPELTVGFVELLYAGISHVATEHRVSVVGGETARGKELVISIALTGTAPDGAVLRSGSQPGDQIWVTGELGGSIAGHHFTFTPRLQESRWLMQHFRPTAMMDLSDGLAMDLPRLAKCSGTGWNVEHQKLPCTMGCTPAQAWGDGEDYELLFTQPPEVSSALVTAWRQAFPNVRLTCIGELTADVTDTLTPGGWDHFKPKSDA